jgi:hypothetical protein
VILEDDGPGFRVVETCLGKLHFFGRTYVDMRHLAICLNGHREHIVSNSFDINGHHCLILLDRLRSKLNLDQFLTFLRDDATLWGDSKLILE